ncbi:MAG: ABC transporter substrate-binding protein [Oscillospiraceae bacterium]|nr:ABC transporter substrate-binding protein [Oscillospiraceae bacterium]
MRTFLVIICLALAVLAASGCSDSDSGYAFNYEGSDVIHIGAAFPFELVTSDNLFLKGVELAVSTVNESGGVLGKTLDVVLRDDEGDSHRAMQIANTFHQQGITAVIGHWSTSVCYFVKDVYEENGVIMLTPAATGLLVFDYEHEFVFRMIPNNQVFAIAIADAVAQKGLSRVALVFSDDEYGRDFAQLLELALSKHNVPVIDRVTSVTSANVRTITDRWRAFGCDTVIIANSGTESAEPILLINSVKQGLSFFGADNFASLSFRQALANQNVALYQATYSEQRMDLEFLEAFRLKHDYEPDVFAVSGYAAVMLLAQAINAAGTTDSSAIAAFLSGLYEHETVAGKLTYNPQTQEFDGFALGVYSLGE